MKKIVFVACLTVQFSVYADYIANPVVVSFTRHTFRGYSSEIPAKKPTVSDLIIKNNIVAYDMDATPQGLAIAKIFGEKAYNNGAAFALNAIHSDPALSGQWNSIRPDLSTERTLTTAAYIESGLEKANPTINPTMTACPTPQGTAIDVVSTTTNFEEQCVQSVLPAQQQLIYNNFVAQYVPLANKFISELGGIPDVTTQDPLNNFWGVISLAGLVEFNSDFKNFSLADVVSNPYVKTNKNARQAVHDALSLFGLEMLYEQPGLIADALAYNQLNYVNTLSAGTQQIVLSHDTDINAILQALGLTSAQSKPSDLAVYPIETITIAYNSQYAAVTRTRLIINKNGSMTKDSAYKTSVIWKGTYAQWEAMIAAVKNNLNQNPPLTSCIATAYQDYQQQCQLKTLHMRMFNA